MVGGSFVDTDLPFASCVSFRCIALNLSERSSVFEEWCREEEEEVVLRMEELFLRGRAFSSSSSCSGRARFETQENVVFSPEDHGGHRHR